MTSFKLKLRMSRWFYVNRCKMAYSQLFQQIKGVTASALSVVPSQMLYVCVRQWEKGTELHLLRERNMWMAVWLVNACMIERGNHGTKYGRWLWMRLMRCEKERKMIKPFYSISSKIWHKIFPKYILYYKIY